MNVFFNFLRILLGLVFVVSGFVKAVDPIGFSYKLEEYFYVFGLTSISHTSLTLSILFCYIEILLGITLIFKVLIKLTLTGYFILLVLFGFLTFYSAYFDVVKDCGCFGDFIKFSPWQSFFKDLILLIVALVLYIFKSRFTVKNTSKYNIYVISIYSFWYVFFIYQTLTNLPIIDFRPYKEGNNIVELMKVPEGAKTDVYKIEYKLKNPNKDQEIIVDDKEFTNNEKYWTWEILNTSEPILVEKGYKPPIHDFFIIHPETNKDLTDSILALKKPILFVVINSLKKSNVSKYKKISNLSNKIAPKVTTIVITSSSTQKIKKLFNNNTIHYFNMDLTTLKTIIRSNPGLLLYKNQKVLKKWSYNEIPNYKALLKKL